MACGITRSMVVLVLCKIQELHIDDGSTIFKGINKFLINYTLNVDVNFN